MSIADRYASATTSSKLKATEGQGDLDVLTAAGWAGKGSNNTATTLYRMKHTGKHIGFHGVVTEMHDWVNSQVKRKAVRHAGARTKEVVERTVMWWLNNSCEHCGGRGHPNFPGTPVMKDDEDCPECHGKGVEPLEKAVPVKHIEMAEAVLGEIDRVTRDTFFAMKVALKG